MRSTKALFAALLFTLMILPCASVIVRADDDDEEQVDADEYDVTARVMRTSLLKGEVNLQRAGGDKSWERATLNLPLIEGDTLATGADARLEIQIDARNYVRVGADSILRIVTLRNDGIVLSLVEGTCTLRLASFDRDKEYFELDAPKTTMSLETPGTYRLDVARDGGSGGRLHLTARDGGRARIYSDTSGFTLRNDHSAELVYDASDEGDWQFTSSAPSFDSWDRWVDERERYLAQRLRYEQRDLYYDGDIWGAEELDAYGDWVQANDYGGWVWRPHNASINNYPNWAPYRHGHWRWCPPYGWTWVGDEPWGWAPYHYGRWVYYNNSWCWAPRGPGSQHRRNWWRPALVAFVNISLSFGEQVAWYPLTYGQHDPYRSNHRRRDDDRHRRPRPNGSDNRRPPHNPPTAGAVTTVPAREFGRRDGRFQPANADIAWRAVAGEPVRPRLPIAPDRTDQNMGGDRARPPRGRASPQIPDASVPAATLLDRQTGAAARRPGRPLDDELRRERLYNGRDRRRPRSPSEEETGTDPAARSTGTAARPARPALPTPREPGDTDTEGDRISPHNVPSPIRPTRPVRPPARDDARPSVDENPVTEPRAERPARRPPPAEPPSSPAEEAPTSSPPLSQERIERHPARPDRPAHIDRDVPVERPSRRQERQETPTPQSEPAVQPEPPPQRPDPPAPRREETPPPPPAEPAAHREETPPAPPPSSPPPPREEEPPRAREPEREEPVRPTHPSEENRTMTPLD